jgi:hypothetical protein
MIVKKHGIECPLLYPWYWTIFPNGDIVLKAFLKCFEPLFFEKKRRPR